MEFGLDQLRTEQVRTVSTCRNSSNLLEPGRTADRFEAKLHYAILVADRSKAGRRPAVSWYLFYHLAR